MRFFRRKVMPQSQKSASFVYATGGTANAALTGANYAQLADEGYAKCLVAYACINKVANSVASVEPHLYRRDRAGKLSKVEAHPLLDLIENPNPGQSGPEFRRYLTSYLQLAGNAYVFGNGMNHVSQAAKPRELQVLNPGKVKVAPGNSLFPQLYEYRPTASEVITYPVNQLTGGSAVLHLKNFNPLSPWYGLSPLWPAALSVDVHTSGLQWNKRLIESGARPSGALVVNGADGKPQTLTDDQYNRVKAMIDEQFSGSANAGRPMLLEGGLEWKEMSINPKDMDFLEGKNSAARDIALAFGVPPQLLGIPGDSTYANYSEAKTAFWTDTALPLLCMILEGFNRWLTPLYGDDLFLWYDEEMVPALEPLRKAKAERINAAGYMTINEKRRAMGLDDIEGGDTLLVQASTIPLELAGTMDLPEPGSPADEESDAD